MPIRELVPFLGLAEPVSALTHLAGALAVLGGLTVLLRAPTSPRARALLALYSLAVAAMLGSSAAYHGLAPDHPARDLFWRLDHASIWIGITATFFAAREVAGGGLVADGAVLPRPTLLAMGLVAAAGATAELLWLSSLPSWISPLLYIGLGWLGFPTLLAVAQRRGWGQGALMLLGGLAATVGGLADVLQEPHLWPGVVEAHELLHGLTLLAGVCYWLVIYGGVSAETFGALAPVPVSSDPR